MKWTHLHYFSFFADRTKYGRAYATVLRPSVVTLSPERNVLWLNGAS